VGTFSGPQRPGAARDARARKRAEAEARNAAFAASRPPVPAPPAKAPGADQEPGKRRARRKTPR
jgi:hypothetical protein